MVTLFELGGFTTTWSEQSVENAHFPKEPSLLSNNAARYRKNCRIIYCKYAMCVGIMGNTKPVGWGNMSTKRKKFVELAEKRVSRALNDLRLIGNLSNRSAYEFSDDDIRKIFRVLQREIDAAKSKFADGAAAKELDFKL